MKRDISFDVAKGIAILGVIVGHYIAGYPNAQLFIKWYWSFHMPLFFIISGYFFRQEKFTTLVYKGIRGLLVPYVITILAVDAFVISKNIYLDNIFPTKGTLVWVLYTILDIYGFPTMAMWFLPALFFGKIEMALLSKVFSNKYFLCFSTILMFSVALILKATSILDFDFIPLSIEYSLFVPFYLFVGVQMKRSKILYFHRYVIVCIISLLILLFGANFSFDIYSFDFPLGPVNLLSAVIITISVLLI